MDFQEFVEMMIKVWKGDGYHNYGHCVKMSGEQPPGFAKCILSERIREGNCPRTETGFSGFRQGSIRNLAMANIFLDFWR